MYRVELDSNRVFPLSYFAQRTRRHFLGMSQWTQARGTVATTTVVGGTWPDWTGPVTAFETAPADAPQGFTSTWVVPGDYVPGTNLTVKVTWTLPTLGGSVDTLWVPRIHMFRFVPGTSLYDATGSTTYTSTGLLADSTTPAKTVYVSTITSAASLASLVSGDTVRLGLDRYTDDTNDAYEFSIYVLGISIEYTAFV